MNSQPSPRSTPGTGPEVLRDQIIASALRRVYGRLPASTCTAYLLTADARALAPAMTVETPLSFTIAPAVPVDDLTWPTAQAHRTGSVVVCDEECVRNVIRRSPEALIHIPVPMVVVIAPIRTARHRFGALALRWVPPREMAEEDLRFLRAVADESAVRLAELVERGGSVEAPPVPLFVSGRPDPRGDDVAGTATPHPPVTAAWSAAGGPFLFQLQRLATELTAAVHTADVLAVTRARTVRPFRGRALALCLAEAGHLHVVGAAGLSRGVVNRIEGTPLSQRTPETDTINEIAVKIFPSVRALRLGYPGLDVDLEREARAYFPLISHGRPVGCCVLEFAESGDPLRTEEIAILAIMLEQVGQSLERAWAYEAEHTLTRTIQRSLLPRSLPHLSEAVLATRYFSAGEGAEVGGDWYDVVPLPDGGLGLVVGEVAGNSLDAVAVMGQLRSGVRAYAAEGHAPATVLERSSRLLAELDTDLTSTCCCVWLDLATGITSIATAGHPGLLITDVRGRIVRPRPPPGPPLGAPAPQGYRQSEVQLTAGSVAALFTSGLLDTRRQGSEAAVDRVIRLLADHRDEDLEVLADRIAGLGRPRESRDQAALLLVRYEGARPEDRARVARTSIRRHDFHAVAEVRGFLHDLLGRWEVLPLLDDLEVLTSEVVTNALIHAHSEVELRLREYPDRIRVEVRDSNPYPPVPTALLEDEVSNQEAESGRGLLIVDALASAWGSSPAGRGKTTWFELAIPGWLRGRRRSGGDTEAVRGTRWGTKGGQVS
ncbi:SpoIIE family protein phosphatase [Streptomyces hygroscopicus]|uniref:SpoIIE family protein phosphatase n=1 Tax=Streptomyces hygroscopicus TaxID=1912 RepID=UPI000781C521|nr:SpoIIE family protein phosphatase [Streptomyces hygroscopicus]